MSIFGVLAAFGAARVKDAVSRNMRLAFLYAAAAFLLICGSGFFIGALHAWIALHQGSIAASLWIGGGFVLVAIIFLIAARIVAARGRKNASALAAAASAAVPVAAGLTSKSLAPRIVGIVGALVIGGILGRQILRKE